MKTTYNKIKKYIAIISLAILMSMVLTKGTIELNKIKQYNVKALTETELESEMWYSEDYWEWYTRTTTDDRAYNGKHIEIKNKEIWFYGYDEWAYKDFLYKRYEKNNQKMFKFIFDETQSNYHTLEGAGLIINSKIENEAISGYILLFTQKKVELYYIDNLNINTFNNSYNSTIASLGKMIFSAQKVQTQIHNLEVFVNDNVLTVKDNNTLVVKENLQKHDGNDFGIIASYGQHDCEILSKEIFKDFDLLIEVPKYVMPIECKYEETKESAPGVIVALYDENNNKIAEVTTDNNGKLQFVDIKSGTYYYKIISDHNDCNTNKIHKAQIDSNGKITYFDEENIIYIKNSNKDNDSSKTIDCIIECKYEDTKQSVAGVVVALYDENNSKIAEETTDNNGKLQFQNIKPGTYYYKIISDHNDCNTNKMHKLQIDNNVNIAYQDGNIIYIKNSNQDKNLNNSINNLVGQSNNIQQNNIENVVFKLPQTGTNEILLGVAFVFLCGMIVFSIIKIRYWNSL